MPRERSTPPAATSPAMSEGEYQTVYETIRREVEQYRSDVAKRFTPIFNARFASTPHQSYEQKKALCRWANEQLRELGLAVKCPKTGLPAIYVADTGPHPERGRFRLKVTTEDGKLRHTLTALEVPTVELMPDPPRREKFAEWRGTKRKPSSRRSK
jgi:hypothetical protein